MHHSVEKENMRELADLVPITLLTGPILYVYDLSSLPPQSVARILSARG